MKDTFIILRRETNSVYSVRGPIAHGMSLKDARAEIIRLKTSYPYQDFVIMSEIGEVTRTERVRVKIDPAELLEGRTKESRVVKDAEGAPSSDVSSEVTLHQDDDVSLEVSSAPLAGL